MVRVSTPTYFGVGKSVWYFSEPEIGYSKNFLPTILRPIVVVQQYIKCKEVKIQLGEHHNHHVNMAKTAIKASKYHIIAGLQRVYPDWPLQWWAKFI